MSVITPHYRSVQQLPQSQSFFIDEYQREYKWEKQSIDELMSDPQAKFFSHYMPGDETTAVSSYGEYFLGSIIVSSRNGKSFLIDGQQRVTSLTLLLTRATEASRSMNQARCCVAAAQQRMTVWPSLPTALLMGRVFAASISQCKARQGAAPC